MPEGKKIKVLIVEDDQMLLRALISKLEQDGFAISQATSGTEALETAKSELPDIILLDLLLPFMNGFEVLSNLKLDAKTRDIPVLILSNLGQAEEIKRGEGLGAAAYLVKADVSLKTITDKVHELLGGKPKKSPTKK